MPWKMLYTSLTIQQKILISTVCFSLLVPFSTPRRIIMKNSFFSDRIRFHHGVPYCYVSRPVFLFEDIMWKVGHQAEVNYNFRYNGIEICTSYQHTYMPTSFSTLIICCFGKYDFLFFQLLFPLNNGYAKYLRYFITKTPHQQEVLWKCNCPPKQ